MKIVKRVLIIIPVILGIVLFAVMCLITYLIVITGDRFLSLLGKGGVNVITRIMGLILTIIAVQMVIVGINGAINLYK